MVVFTAAGQWAQFQKISAIVLRSEDYIFFQLEQPKTITSHRPKIA